MSRSQADGCGNSQHAGRAERTPSTATWRLSVEGVCLLNGRTLLASKPRAAATAAASYRHGPVAAHVPLLMTSPSQLQRAKGRGGAR